MSTSERVAKIGGWAVFVDYDARAIVCCDKGRDWCWAFAHTMPWIHRGPVFRFRRWWCPRRSAVDAVMMARAWCERMNDRENRRGDSIEDIRREIRDAQEVERIIGELS